jgi:hypothetical protein
MKDLFEKSIKNSYSYREYRELVANLLDEGKSTAVNDSEALADYSKLNNSRMKRLDKTLKLNSEITESAKNLKKNQTWLIISEGWCGDAAQNIPVINKIAELSENINLRIVLRDKNIDLMNNFLTNGGQQIPKLIILNEDLKAINSWGPRPTFATNMVKEHKEIHGGIDAEFKQNLQVWYNKNKGEAVSKDFIEILTK